MNHFNVLSDTPLGRSVMRRTGIASSAVVALALCADAMAQLLAVPAIVDAANEIGYSRSADLWRAIGALLLVSTALYALPRTAFIGALLITGFLGGAIASHVRVGDGAFSPIVIALILAALAWAGLWLRDDKLRAVVRGL